MASDRPVFYEDERGYMVMRPDVFVAWALTSPAAPWDEEEE